MKKTLSLPYFVKLALYIWLVIMVVMIPAGAFIISRLYQDNTNNYLAKFDQAVNIPAYTINTKIQQCNQAFIAIDGNSQLQTYLSLARPFSLLDTVQLKTFLQSFKNSLEAGIGTEDSEIYIQPFNNVMLASFMRSEPFVPADIKNVVLAESNSIVADYQQPGLLTLYRANLRLPKPVAIQIIELKLHSLQEVARQIKLPEGAFSLILMPDNELFV